MIVLNASEKRESFLYISPTFNTRKPSYMLQVKTQKIAFFKKITFKEMKGYLYTHKCIHKLIAG